MKKLLAVLAAVLLVAGTASAEPTLQQWLDSIIVTGPSITISSVKLPDGSDAYWMVGAATTAATTLLVEYAGNANTNTFGIYDPYNMNKIQIFSGLDSPGIATGGKSSVTLNYNSNTSKYDVYVGDFVTVDGTLNKNIFGFYLGVGNTYYYSDSNLNQGSDRMWAWQGNDKTWILTPGTDANGALFMTKEWMLAFEDGSDFDYQDMVVMVESVAPVPEPATMMLLGAGLLGLAAYGRKKLI